MLKKGHMMNGKTLLPAFELKSNDSWYFHRTAKTSIVKKKIDGTPDCSQNTVHQKCILGY